MLGRSWTARPEIFCRAIGDFPTVGATPLLRPMLDSHKELLQAGISVTSTCQLPPNQEKRNSSDLAGDGQYFYGPDFSPPQLPSRPVGDHTTGVEARAATP
jgi:hypothetical protein